MGPAVGSSTPATHGGVDRAVPHCPAPYATVRVRRPRFWPSLGFLWRKRARAVLVAQVAVHPPVLKAPREARVMFASLVMPTSGLYSLCLNGPS